jgi:hypothetical protein
VTLVCVWLVSTLVATTFAPLTAASFASRTWPLNVADVTDCCALNVEPLPPRSMSRHSKIGVMTRLLSFLM